MPYLLFLFLLQSEDLELFHIVNEEFTDLILVGIDGPVEGCFSGFVGLGVKQKVLQVTTLVSDEGKDFWVTGRACIVKQCVLTFANLHVLIVFLLAV